MICQGIDCEQVSVCTLCRLPPINSDSTSYIRCLSKSARHLIQVPCPHPDEVSACHLSGMMNGLCNWTAAINKSVTEHIGRISRQTTQTSSPMTSSGINQSTPGTSESIGQSCVSDVFSDDSPSILNRTSSLILILCTAVMVVLILTVMSVIVCRPLAGKRSQISRLSRPQRSPYVQHNGAIQREMLMYRHETSLSLVGDESEIP